VSRAVSISTGVDLRASSRRPLADLHAVQARQHQVQDDDVVTVLRRQPVAIEAVGGVVHLEPAALEELADHFGNVAVVLDDQDQSRRFLRCAHGIPLVFSFVKRACSRVQIV
jgi:hypothetical protein